MVFGMSYMENTICRVWSSQRKKYTPSVSGAESTSSTSENTVLLSTLVLSGKLYGYLSDIDTQARNKLDLLVTQLAEKEGINESLKAQNQLAWIGAMNNIRNRAEEFINAELIFA